ncbi:mitochondrial import receptor subunit TOM20-like isoform X1 [Ananas comosus]|uniref:Mitochondrial import receptor subunit TOM20-like isoform X1 n=1 Tax=Ananas comosus TaxID=4615 RepID=A0A6P5EMQ8_ANACO|nr:mitochondrial import receptor subunit TOM20-like isoform X1 [Ananas comosus]
MSCRSIELSEAMAMRQKGLDSIVFFEDARKAAEEAYAKNPLDAENLTRWGGALFELSQFQNDPDIVKYVEDSISKLEEALEVVPRKHDALWCLGNAHTSLAFYTPDLEMAKTYFAKATQCFEQALEEDPRNELYLKSLDLSFRAPELHLEFHRQMTSQQASQGASSSPNAKASKKNKNKKDNSDLKYDVLGWVILVARIVAWGVGMTKYNVPYPPSGH